MENEEKWDWKTVANGYGELRITSWKLFVEFIQEEMLDFDAYVWRGQRHDQWELESNLDRLIKKAKIARTKRWDFRQSHLEQFKYAVRGRRGINPPKLNDENEWWALGQHHGLSTPLLDWSMSPFVAAYFAFINEGKPQSHYRAIYAIHKPSVEDRVKELVDIKEKDKRQEDEDISLGKSKPRGHLKYIGTINF